MKNKKIAIVGSGISGLGLSYIAHKNDLNITLIEKGNYFGGHSNTIDLSINGKNLNIDTGFLVHNKVTYPNLIQLFDLLGVVIVDSQMTLSIKLDDRDFEWGGKNLSTVFGQKRNLLNPKFYHFLYEIVDFNNNAPKFLEWAKHDTNRTLGDLLKEFNYSKKIQDWYIIPMAAAIWSTPANKILQFPAHTFITFALNHHLLQVNDRPVWRTIKGGSREYVKKITDLIIDKRLNTEVTAVKILEDLESENSKIELTLNHEEKEIFDYVIFASHADQTFNLIQHIHPMFKEVLNPFKYERNIAVVHSDTTFLPKRKNLWSAWNYLSSQSENAVTVSYLINHLQPVDTEIPIIVTLNPHKNVQKNLFYREIEYHHPLFDADAINMQSNIQKIQGFKNIFFAGAWGGYGFHEDGLKSAIKVAQILKLQIPWKESL